MLQSTFGTDGRGVAGVFGHGALIGLVAVLGGFASYGIGAGYIFSLATPSNLVAAGVLATASLGVCVTVARHARRP